MPVMAKEICEIKQKKTPVITVQENKTKCFAVSELRIALLDRIRNVIIKISTSH